MTCHIKVWFITNKLKLEFLKLLSNKKNKMNVQADSNQIQLTVKFGL